MRNHKVKCVIMTGGGTGGHVYPALPVIRLLKNEGYRICWIGSYKGIERGLVQSWDISYKPIFTGKMRRYFSFRNFTDIFKIIFGFFQSFFFLIQNRPVLVFSKGGFVSVPPVIAAALLKIPVLTHDSDVDPGLATKINSRFARKIFVAYEKSLPFYPPKIRSRTVVSGNPVRSEFYNRSEQLPADWLEKIGSKKVLVIVGGSLGAQQLNQLVRNSLSDLTRDFFVIHQMGQQNYSPLDHKNYLPLPYINEELPALFQRADLALSRAGAGILWELASAGTPSILLPLIGGSRGDQVKNAAVFQKEGISEILPDQAKPEDLIQMIRNILDNQDKLSSMKKAAEQFIGIPAEEIIFSSIREEESP